LIYYNEFITNTIREIIKKNQRINSLLTVIGIIVTLVPIFMGLPLSHYVSPFDESLSGDVSDPASATDSIVVTKEPSGW